MDYSSDDIYDFEHYISRFNYSLCVVLITYYFTHDKISTLAGFFPTTKMGTPRFKKEFSNFKSIEKRNIPKTEIPKVKDRIINPLVKEKRLINN